MNYLLIQNLNISELVAISEWWSGSHLKVYISKEDLEKAGTEHALLVMNHTYEVDWLFGWMFCEKIGNNNNNFYSWEAIFLPEL